MAEPFVQASDFFINSRISGKTDVTSSMKRDTRAQGRDSDSRFDDLVKEYSLRDDRKDDRQDVRTTGKSNERPDAPVRDAKSASDAEHDENSFDAPVAQNGQSSLSQPVLKLMAAMKAAGENGMAEEVLDSFSDLLSEKGLEQLKTMLSELNEETDVSVLQERVAQIIEELAPELDEGAADELQGVLVGMLEKKEGKAAPIKAEDDDDEIDDAAVEVSDEERVDNNAIVLAAAVENPQENVSSENREDKPAEDVQEQRDDQRVTQRNDRSSRQEQRSARAERSEQDSSSEHHANRAEQNNQNFQTFFEGVLNNRRTASQAQPAPMSLNPNAEFNQAETLRDGLVNVVRFVRADGEQRASVIVDPPALGRITVELTSNTNGVEASIKVVNEQVRQLVQDQLTQLRMNLEQQGVQVTQFAVDVQQDDGQRQQDEEQGRQRQGRRIRAIDEADEDEAQEEFRVDLEQGLLYWVA